MEVHQIFISRLKNLRLAKRVTQKQVSKYLKLSTSGYSNIELGYSYPSIEILYLLCKYFDVSSDYFFGLEG